MTPHALFGEPNARRAFGMVLAAIALAAAPVAAESKPPPFAVMPFLDLAQDQSLSWLSDGVAETLATDLKRSGFVVVERSAIDAALAELALATTAQIEPSTASKLGKMVGAKTVVVGSFQVSGKSVRLVARFVEVETGLVRGSAKATGTRSRIFAIQDEIAAELTGKKPKRRRRKRKKKNKRTAAESPASMAQKTQTGSGRSVGAEPQPAQVEPVDTHENRDVWAAYRLFSRSIRLEGAAKKALLQASLEFDPDFRYSLDALAAVEARFEKARMAAGIVRGQSADRLMEMARDENLAAAERARAARIAVTQLITARNITRAIEVEKEVYALKLTAEGPVDINAFALQQLVSGYSQIGEYDEAIRLAEEFVARYPQSPMLPSVEANLRGNIRTLHRRAELKRRYPAELLKLENNYARHLKMVEGQKRRGKLKPLQNERKLHALNARRCTLRTQYFVDADAETYCLAYIAKYAEDNSAAEAVAAARFALMYYFRNIGAFEKMREMSNEIQQHHPKRAREAREAVHYIPR